MSTDASEFRALFMIQQMLRELWAYESRTSVKSVFLWYNVELLQYVLKSFFCLQCFIGRQTDLELNVNVAGGHIHEDYCARVHGRVNSLSSRSEQTTLCAANKVIHSDLVAKKLLDRVPKRVPKRVPQSTWT
jgi:hypothetical protein